MAAVKGKRIGEIKSSRGLLPVAASKGKRIGEIRSRRMRVVTCGCQ